MKDFKLAHIVPRRCLAATADNQYHMCLAHLVQEERLDWGGTNNHTYTDFYKKMAADGRYVLMDNGAAEKSQLGVSVLLEVYDLVKPTEIVIPDTLCVRGETLWKMRCWMDNFPEGKLPYKLLGVPQGGTMQEWKQCAITMLELYGGRLSTIGISKFLNIALGDPNARMEAALHVQKVALSNGLTHIEIHLLGCDEGPAIVRQISKAVPMVRGCDSAFAYIHAQFGAGPIVEETKRPEGEIDFLGGMWPNGLEKRMQEMGHIAGVEDNGLSEKWEV